MTALVFLPGMLCDAASWRAQTNALGGEVVSFGLLDSFDAMAEAVLAEAPPRFALAGHSMGGRVALEVHRRAPERIAALMLLATDYRGHLSAEARAAEEARRDGMLARIDAEGMRAFAQGWVRQVVAEDNLADAALVTGVVEMIVRQGRDACAAQTLAGLTPRDQSDVLAEVRCPTLICAGEFDTLRPVEVHRDMAARVPGSRLAVVEGAAHMVAMERPDALVAAMREWLSHT